MQATQDFKLDFLLESSQFLNGRYKSQDILNTLPPCRFTISKRGLQVKDESGNYYGAIQEITVRSPDERDCATAS